MATALSLVILNILANVGLSLGALLGGKVFGNDVNVEDTIMRIKMWSLTIRIQKK